jgi:hypothetical protein
MTLEPGDLIPTGTPAGVAAMKPGDQVEVKVEGIGVLANPVDGLEAGIGEFDNRPAGHNKRRGAAGFGFRVFWGATPLKILDFVALAMGWTQRCLRFGQSSFFDAPTAHPGDFFHRLHCAVRPTLLRSRLAAITRKIQNKGGNPSGTC